jgi:hypothetical protein
MAGRSALPAGACPGCGLELPEPRDAPPERAGASAGCWSLFTDLLGRSYNDPARYRLHQLLVDAYTAQHVDWTRPAATRGTVICLMTLCLFVEDGADPRHGPQLHQRMTARPGLHPLPIDQRLLHDRMTIGDLAAADDDTYERALRAWAADVWAAWGTQHATIRHLITKTLG